MNKHIEALMQGFVDAMHAEAHRLFQKGSDSYAEFSVAADVFEAWVTEEFEGACDSEGESRWERGMARDLESGLSGMQEMIHLQAEARKLK